MPPPQKSLVYSVYVAFTAVHCVVPTACEQTNCPQLVFDIYSKH